MNQGRVEVLFAHAYFVVHDRRSQGYMHPLPPLRHAQVAAYLENQAEARVSVWDPTFRLGTDAFEVEVSRMRPQIVWLYTHPTTRAAASSMIAAARRAGAVVVVGGPDAELKPSPYLRAGADAAIVGEEEAPSLGLLLRLRAQHYQVSSELLLSISGLSALGADGRLWTAKAEGRPVAIETLPRPHRGPEDTRIHLERWSNLRSQRPLALVSARGCPVSCGFCTNAVFGRPYRRRAPSDVVAEMLELANSFELDRFVFADEVFLFDPVWLREFSDLLRQEAAPVPFEVQGHPGLIDAPSVERLAAVGLDRVELQAASGSASLLSRLRWSYGPSEVYRAASILRRFGLEIGLQCMVGLPGERRADLEATLEMIELIRPEGVDVTRVDPGSPALFRKNWERVVAGPHADALGEESSVPGPIVDAAVAWMRSVGGAAISVGKDPTQGLWGRLQKPALRAAVRWLPDGEFPLRFWGWRRNRAKALLPPGPRGGRSS